MMTKLVLAGAASLLMAGAALAEPEAKTAPASASTPTAAPDAAATAAPAPATAETGAATNTSAVTEGDLRTGAKVVDASGAAVGEVTKVIPSESGGPGLVTVKRNGKTTSVPASSLSLNQGALVSSRTQAEVWSDANR